MATRKKAEEPVTEAPQEPVTAAPSQDARPEGRFYDLQEELAPKRRGHYRLTSDIVVPMPTRRQVKAFVAGTTADEKMQALLGEQWEAVDALFEDRPADEWIAFQNDFQNHFFGQGANGVPGGSQGS